MFMKKILIFCFIVILLAVSLSPETNTTAITGFLIQAGSFVLTMAKYVIKELLSLVIKVL